MSTPALAEVWVPVAGGAWGTASNWNPASVPNATGAVADFSNVNLTGDAAITLDALRTVGTLSFGDTDASSAAGWIINTGTGTNALRLGVASGTPTVTVNALGTGKGATINAQITGTQGLIKNGLGTLFLTNANNGATSTPVGLSGTVTINAGTISVNGLGALWNFSSATVLNGGTLQYTGPATATGRVITLGSNGGTLDFSGAGAFDLTFGVNTTTLAPVVAMPMTGSGARTLGLAGTQTMRLFATINDGTGGATSISKSGSGAWTLPANNNLSGNLSVTGGTLTLSGTNPNVANISATGGSLLLTGNTTYSGTTTVGANGFIRVGNGTNGGLSSGEVTIGTGGTLQILKSNSNTYANSITGAGGISVGGGDGVWNFTNASFTGPTAILQGTYLNNNASTSNFVLGTNSIFAYGLVGLTNADFIGPLGTTGGGVTFNSVGSGGFTATQTGTRIVNIGGSATPDTLTLGVGGFYAGSSTTVDSRLAFGDPAGTAPGVINFKNSIALNGRAFKTVVNGAQGVAAILSGDISGTGRSDGTKDALVKFGNASLLLTGTNTYSGATVVGGTQAIIIGAVGALSPNTNVILSGASGGTAAGVLGLGAGDLSFNLGTNPGELSWATNVSGGFAAYGGDRVVTLNSGSSLTWAATAGFLSSNQNLVLGLPSADGMLSLNNPIDLNGAVRTIVVNNGSAAIDARLTQNVTGAAGSGLVKSGLGTLLLAGTNGYAGNTLVSQGQLTLANSGSLASNTTVNSGTTLRNDGIVSGNLLINSGGILQGTGTFIGDSVVNGTLSPGNSAGTLTFDGNLTLSDTTITQLEMAAGATLESGHDKVIVNSGTLTYEGTLNIDLGANSYASGSQFNFFDGAVTGGFNEVNLLGSSYGGLGALFETSLGSGVWSAVFDETQFIFTSGDGILSLQSSAVPEPITAAGVILLSCRVLGRRGRVSL